MLTSLFVYFLSSFDNRIFIKTKPPYLQFGFSYLCYIRPIPHPNTLDLIQLLLFLFLRGFNYLSFVKIFLRYCFLTMYANVELNSGGISFTGDTKRSVILLRKRLTGAMTGFHDVHTYPDVTDNLTRTLLTSE